MKVKSWGFALVGIILIIVGIYGIIWSNNPPLGIVPLIFGPIILLRKGLGLEPKR